MQTATREVEPFLFTDNSAESTLFADDTSALLCDRDPVNLFIRTKATLHAIHQWYVCNKLSLSLGKSNYIIFHKKNSKLARGFPDTIQVGNTHINRVISTKYIGIQIDEHLSWT